MGEERENREDRMTSERNENKVADRQNEKIENE